MSMQCMCCKSTYTETLLRTTFNIGCGLHPTLNFAHAGQCSLSHVMEIVGQKALKVPMFNLEFYRRITYCFLHFLNLPYLNMDSDMVAQLL